MLRRSLLIILAISIMTVPCINEANAKKKKSSSDLVQARLVELFELCKADKNSEAAGYFVYRGPDKTRKWKDVYDYSKEMEKMAVDRNCARIKAYLVGSEKYEFGAFHKEKESEGTWNVIEVTFIKGDETNKASFAFLKINGEFAIGDID